MEEAEIPTEKLQEDIHHHAERSRSPWMSYAALSTALLAALAALAALLAGHHANEAIMEQIHASDQWAFFQAKGIKAAVLASKMDLLRHQGLKTEKRDQDQLERYEKEQEQIKEKAGELERSLRSHFHRHTILARSVTMFQVGIAMAAIAVLLERKPLWCVSMALGVMGLFFLAQGVLSVG